jgi:hypothetical protein
VSHTRNKNFQTQLANLQFFTFNGPAGFANLLQHAFVVQFPKIQNIPYKTDEFTLLNGILVDEVSVGGVPVDNAENGANGWELNGIMPTDGLENEDAPRQYRTYDKAPQTGPYAYGVTLPSPDWVHHFPYQDGLLVTYWDTSWRNNNTSLHPG